MHAVAAPCALHAMLESVCLLFNGANVWLKSMHAVAALLALRAMLGSVCLLAHG